ncbi:hypothetical protein G3T14_21370 [Methylobacterium sp. BTF04]|uniref:hypothetical protein n=1 Tax=Methylobacterium sp. BTF04 TaxID=2708300 RepID=UPI0013D7A0BC|nr:hypothetical protein [Methylobacterium sp. BTF04]NEU14637.1 hypothetical protein [Methylobacterium sp. BTF04]
MSAPDIKTSYDREIVRLVAEGFGASQISRQIGRHYEAVLGRLRALRLDAQAHKNTQAQRAARRPVVARRGYRFRRGALAAAIVGSPRFDTAASDLARRLKRERAVLDAVDFDPSHLIACFHAAGLTLDDIEECVGVSPAMAASAIRRAHQIDLS